MNYYYDIILNWSEEDAYSFYEWNDTDGLELIKKIPLIKVKHKEYINFIHHHIKVNAEFLNMIKDKTLVSGKKVMNKISYACLFTDGKNVLALEFDKSGKSISRSNLLVDDELNVLEITYALKDYILEYEVLEKLENRKLLRQEEEAKRLIALEINSLYKKKDKAKLKYLYYEYKKEKIEDICFIYERIMDDLNNNFSEDILKLYYIIKLSYHNV